MIGEWKTRSGHYATIDKEIVLPTKDAEGKEGIETYYLGTMTLPPYGRLRMLWNDKGDAIERDFDLATKRRSEEHSW